MFGQINKIATFAGKRDKVVRLVMSGSDTMPGCRSYIVAKDANAADIVWVTEVWDSADMHAASMDIPEVKAAVAQAMPMIAGFETVATITPGQSQTWKPDAYPSMSPYLISPDADSLIRFAEAAFGGILLRRFDRPDGSLMHAEVKIDDSVFDDRRWRDICPSGRAPCPSVCAQCSGDLCPGRCRRSDGRAEATKERRRRRSAGRRSRSLRNDMVARHAIARHDTGKRRHVGQEPANEAIPAGRGNTSQASRPSTIHHIQEIK